MQRERRRDPYPWTWEIPLLVITGTLFVMVLGIQLARSLANLAAGASWTWPETTTGSTGSFGSPIGTAFWSSLPGVLAGHGDAGLPTPTPDGLAGRGLVWTSLLFTEVALTGVTIWVGVYVYQRWGNGRMRGMATAAEAQKILGVTRLRKVAGIVRPDIYGRHAAPPAPVHREAGPVEAPRARIGRGPHKPRNIVLGNPWLHPGRNKPGDPAGGPR